MEEKVDIKAIIRKCGLVRESIINPDALSAKEWNRIIGILVQTKQPDKFVNKLIREYSPFGYNKARLLAGIAGKFELQNSCNIHTDCTPDTCENCSREFVNKIGENNGRN